MKSKDKTRTRVCIECEKEFTKNEIKRVNKKWICIFCKRKKRDKRRDEILHTVGGVRRKEDIMKEAKEKRKKRSLWGKIFKSKENVLPGIKSAKPKKRVSVLGMYLTREERYLLFKKYCSNGLSPQDASEKVKERAKFLTDLIQKLRAEKRSEESINKIFKEEFAKLCESE